jgi:hypothetical protein
MFQPTDYLQDLNLDFANVSPEIPQNDLDLFSQADFFDLDVFSKQPKVKQEDDSLAFLNLPMEYGKTESKAEYSGENSVNEFSISTVSTPLDSAYSAASEDKRKRNTAASARFRIKKKLKEQEMEQRSKEMHEKVSNLEKKLKTLEMENKCLRNLILQQNEKKNSVLLEDIKKRSILDSKLVFEYTN